MDEQYLASLLAWIDFQDDNTGIRWNSSAASGDVETFTESTLANVRGVGRLLSQTNEYAISAHRNRVNYIVGDGLNYTVEDVDQSKPAPEPEKTALKKWLDTFAEVNDLPSVERESMWRFDTEGEVFLELYDGDDMPEVRFVEPEQISSSGKGSTEEGEMRGILFEPTDVRSILGYRKDGEIVEESEIVHLKANVTSKARRGIPLFYPVFGGLIECKDLLKGMTKAAKARAKIALLIKVAGLNQTNASSILSRLTANDNTGPIANGNASIPIEKMPYGSALRVNANDSYDFPAAQLGAADYIEVLQARLRGVGVAAQMSEWMFTGLADQKYSNSFVVEAPTLKSFLATQGMLCKAFGSGRYKRQASIVRRAMMRAESARQIPKDWLTKFKINCSGPVLEARDMTTESTVNNAYITSQVLSRESVRQKLGVDNQQEEARIEREKAIYPAPVPVGTTPALPVVNPTNPTV